MVSLLDQSLDDANLFEAWLKVRANKGAAGVDGQTIEQFAINVFGRLQTLRDHVRRGEYRPMALLRVAIPKRVFTKSSRHSPQQHARLGQPNPGL